MSSPVVDTPEVVRFKTAFKVKATGKVKGVSLKEQEDQDLLKRAKRNGVEGTRLRIESKERMLTTALTEAALAAGRNQPEAVEQWNDRAKLKETEVANEKKSLEMLEHSNKKWTEFTQKWTALTEKPVPEGRKE